MYIENHLIFCCSLVILLIKLLIFLNIKYNILYIIFLALFFSILPDIDHPKSYLGNKFKLISNFIFYIFGHRTFTHSLLILFIIYIIYVYLNFFVLLINKNIILGIYIGYISHIISDMITYNGVYFFWPYKYKIRFPLLYLFIKKKQQFYFCILILIISIILCLYKI